MASVALPACTSFTSAVFEGGICHTLASYVSMQTLPTFTESGGHLSVPAPADPAAARHTTATRTMPNTEGVFMVLTCPLPPLFWPTRGTDPHGRRPVHRHICF